eukprot:TRINITY_DN40544_c0_g1_i1.p1 TRINITY_DN40544_c0_g1~~TRINITY_DN40544_c0_g1_i1.p1  ORF type:complete len:179 (+),score=19.21 TRINITY_DN40544_c0_g1_i1:99-635(+)
MDDFTTRKYLTGALSKANVEMGRPDSVLQLFGFQVDLVSTNSVEGRLQVSEKCCQPFRVLHGGVSALICEGLASMGAHVASGFQRIAGVELNINHLKSVALGEHVFAQAKPITVGKKIQVWEVKLWKVPVSLFVSKINTSELPQNSTVAISRVTFLSGLPVPNSAKSATDSIKRLAKM